VSGAAAEMATTRQSNAYLIQNGVLDNLA